MNLVVRRKVEGCFAPSSQAWRRLLPSVSVRRGRLGRPTVRVKGRTHPQDLSDGQRP